MRTLPDELSYGEYLDLCVEDDNPHPLCYEHWLQWCQILGIVTKGDSDAS